MSKFTNRPMSEYEAANHAALGIILCAVVRLGANSPSLRAALLEAADEGRRDCTTNFAASLEFLASLIPEARK